MLLIFALSDQNGKLQEYGKIKVIRYYFDYYNNSVILKSCLKDIV